MNAALVTPFLGHLPLHPGSYLGYGTAIFGRNRELDTMDLNARIYYENKAALQKVLWDMDDQQVVMDRFHLNLFNLDVAADAEKRYKDIPWQRYHTVFIAPPSWFVTVPTEDVLRLSRCIQKASRHTRLCFYGNSLGSWTDENALRRQDVHIKHLNHPHGHNAVNEPVCFDALPPPVYGDRHQYLFDALPFRLKHGCPWGKCRFCSLAKGWNSGELERSPTRVIQEIATLMDRYDPKMLVCRDNAVNGNNLLEFCTAFERFQKPWLAMARADLSTREIEALQKAGCRLLYFGLESGSDRILLQINKGIDSRRMSDFVKTLADHGIIPAPSVIVGSPGETEDDFEKTLRFIIDHKRYLDIINVYTLMLTSGSDFSLMNHAPDGNAAVRLKRLIAVCRDMGLKVCVGQQSAEYALFKRVDLLGLKGSRVQGFECSNTTYEHKKK